MDDKIPSMDGMHFGLKIKLRPSVVRTDKIPSMDGIYFRAKIGLRPSIVRTAGIVSENAVN